MNQMSAELPGLKAKLDRIVYYHDDRQLPCDAPHAFIYFITISNLSDTTVTLKGRRWVVREESGHQQVIESEGIVGKEPTIAPGEIFQYNSYHMPHCNCRANGSFHGVDRDGNAVHVKITEFELRLPETDEEGAPK